MYSQTTNIIALINYVFDSYKLVDTSHVINPIYRK